MKSKAKDHAKGLQQLQQMPAEAKSCLGHVFGNGIQIIQVIAEQILESPSDPDRARARSLVHACQDLTEELRQMMRAQDAHLGAVSDEVPVFQK